jgi:hypothetical protein
VVDTAGEIEDGTTIKLDRFHVGLCEWGNTAYLVDDDLSRIKAVEYTTPVGYVKERVKDWAMRLPEGAWRRISAGALAAIVMMVGVEIAMAHAKHIPSTFISFVERTTL